MQSREFTPFGAGTPGTRVRTGQPPWGGRSADHTRTRSASRRRLVGQRGFVSQGSRRWEPESGRHGQRPSSETAGALAPGGIPCQPDPSAILASSGPGGDLRLVSRGSGDRPNTVKVHRKTDRLWTTRHRSSPHPGLMMVRRPHRTLTARGVHATACPRTSSSTRSSHMTPPEPGLDSPARSAWPPTARRSGTLGRVPLAAAPASPNPGVSNTCTG